MKRQLFYLIDEHDNEIKFCKRKGLIPYSFNNTLIPGTDIIYTKVNKYKSNEAIYTSLEARDCYSGYTVTLMREPELSCGKLIEVLKTSKIEDEKLGALGILLKKYPETLKEFLDKTQDKSVYRLLQFIRKFNGYSCAIIDRIISD